MKITKKEFINAMVTNHTAFCGMTRRLFSSDECFCAIRGLFEPGTILEKRACVARSTFLEFTGGSRLYLDQKVNYTFHKYEYAQGTIYICLEVYHDNFDNTNYEKAMYYLVVA